MSLKHQCHPECLPGGICPVCNKQVDPQLHTWEVKLRYEFEVSATNEIEAFNKAVKEISLLDLDKYIDIEEV